MPFRGCIEVLLDCHCRRQQLDRQRQRFQFNNGREVIPEWVTFEVAGVENRDIIYIISIDAPEYQEIRFVTDATSVSVSSEPETEEAEEVLPLVVVIDEDLDEEDPLMMDLWIENDYDGQCWM